MVRFKFRRNPRVKTARKLHYPDWSEVWQGCKTYINHATSTHKAHTFEELKAWCCRYSEQENEDKPLESDMALDLIALIEVGLVIVEHSIQEDKLKPLVYGED